MTTREETRYWSDWSKIAILPTPPAFDAPVRGGIAVGTRNITITFGVEKLGYCGYVPTVINFEDTFIRFDRIHKHDRRTG